MSVFAIQMTTQIKIEHVLCAISKLSIHFWEKNNKKKEKKIQKKKQKNMIILK